MSARMLPSHQCRIGEVCKRLGRSAPAVRRLIEKGHLKAFWVGQERVFIRAEVEAYALRMGGEQSLVTHVAARMMALGRTDFEILAELDISLEELTKVRGLFDAHQQRERDEARASVPAPVSRTGDTMPAPAIPPSERPHA